MLLKTGSGLNLIPHTLNNGDLIFEGYDKDMKHLFTFSLDNRTLIEKQN